MKVVGIIITVLILIGGCCIGALFLGKYALDSGLQTTIQPQVEGTPAVEKFVGKVESITLSYNQTAQQAQSGNDNRMAMNISGDKGSALLLVKINEEGGLDKLDWAVLEAEGNTYAVMGTPPETMDVINLDGTPGTSPASEQVDAPATGADGGNEAEAVGATESDGADGTGETEAPPEG